jgi:hypothetical protein
MDPHELRITSFIVKIYVDRSEDGSGPVTWHGQVTHVPSGARRGLRDLDEIAGFVAPYLEEQGWRPPIGWRLRQWLGAWNRKRCR